MVTDHQLYHGYSNPIMKCFMKFRRNIRGKFGIQMAIVINSNNLKAPMILFI